MNIAKPVFGVVHAAFQFVPYDAVSKYPALIVGKLENHSPRNPEQPLTAIRITEIEPERPRRLQHALEFQKHSAKICYEIPIVFSRPIPPF